jgi:hypothetical protein
MTMGSFSQAKELLGASPVYGLEEVEIVFGVTFTPEQRTELENIPFSAEVVKACAGTHMLFPGFGLSLLDIREKCSELFYAKSGGWYAAKRETFSRAPVPIRWHLLRMEPVSSSFSKSWDEQCALLLADEEVPSAATVAFATMLHFIMSKQRLFERTYVRVSDKDADGNRVRVGIFDAGGLFVGHYWVDNRGDGLGLSSARKF